MYTDPLRPRLLRFILVDPFACGAGLALVVAWALILPVAQFGYLPLGVGRLIFTPAEAGLLMHLGGLLTLAGAPILLLRVRSFLLALYQGVESWGEISRIDSRWWGRRLEYFYFFQGVKRHSRVLCLRRPWAMQLSTADKVLVVHNPYQPERVVMKDLYT